MKPFVPWDSQELDEWAGKYAPGKFIDLDGGSTHYIEKGAGEPVILVHGFFYDTYTWNNNMDVLAHRFKVYALDLWGFGYSAREPMDYGYPLYARQVLEFMDALHIEKASLMGHSMGGGTSIYFAVRHRDRVNKLILVDSAGIPGPLPLMGKIANLPGVGEFLYGMNNNFVRRMALSTSWIYDKRHITVGYFEHVTRPQKIRGTTDGMLKILRKDFFHTLTDDIHRLGETDIPVLIAWGRHDKAIPLQRGEEMHGILKNARMEVFDRSGHCPHDEQPEEFNPLAIDFLS